MHKTGVSIDRAFLMLVKCIIQRPGNAAHSSWLAKDDAKGDPEGFFKFETPAEDKRECPLYGALATKVLNLFVVS